MCTLTGLAAPAPKRKLGHSPTAATRYSDSPAQTSRTTSELNLGADRSPSLIRPSSFRNVSSCSRCRLRKTRCDQRLPRCRPCEKAGARCVSYDAPTKREIPRSYVYFLEARVNYLTGVLVEHEISFKAVTAFDEFVVDAGSEGLLSVSHFGGDNGKDDGQLEKYGIATPETGPHLSIRDTQRDSPDPRLLPDREECGIRFKDSVLRTATDSGRHRTIRESLSGLHAETCDMNCFVLPHRPVAEKLANCYFEYANPQMPVLLKDEFMEVFDRAYSGHERSPRSLFFLHIAFAIGAGIVWDGRCSPADGDMPVSRSVKRRKVSSSPCQPRDYHVDAVKCLELSLNSCDDRFGKLKELQAVILLAHFALLQPVAPGPAHLAEVAIRTAVNMGLYCEDEADASFVDGCPSNARTTRQDKLPDLRRRLWWSAYSLDRLVAPYIGRPLGISDHVITTELPSLLDENVTSREPYSKLITHHYFKLRMLQSEIHEVLQYQRAQNTMSFNKRTACTILSSPLLPFDSIPYWRRDMTRRLDEWKGCIPEQKTGDCFPVVLLELDYWQTINQLYRPSIKVPAKLIEMTPATDPARYSSDETGPENSIYLKVAEASGKVLQLYRLMRHVQLVDYTYLATHSIFLAGSSFLFTIWHSPLIRSQLTLNDIDYTLLAATTILADMGDGYTHAGSCRGALERMGAATVQMCLSTAEFSSRVSKPFAPPLKSASPCSSSPSKSEKQLDQYKDTKRAQAKRKASHLPRFDMNLEGLLSGLDQNQKPSRGQPQPLHGQKLKDFNPTLSEQIPPFPFAEYLDLASPESPPPRQQVYNTTTESVLPINMPGSSYDEFPKPDSLPVVGLGLFEFDPREFIDCGNLDESTDSGGAFGRTDEDFSFSITVDSQYGFDKGIHDCLSTDNSDNVGASRSAMSEGALPGVPGAGVATGDAHLPWLLSLT